MVAYWGLIFLLLAIVSGVFGFGTLSSPVMEIARLIFVSFSLVAVGSLVAAAWSGASHRDLDLE